MFVTKLVAGFVLALAIVTTSATAADAARDSVATVVDEVVVGAGVVSAENSIEVGWLWSLWVSEPAS
ncbi:MAG: hypothetical protein AAFR01_02520, partial [Pseudomonadota bacterium]